ncbi:MAG: hypothetical protein ABI639_03890 [Thermoanaerobaculia bacterium]
MNARLPALRFAWFVTPHGFGHAARSAAVIEALGEEMPEAEVDLWTSVPLWFFEESITVPFGYRPLRCDVGLVQKNPIEEDVEASLQALADFWKSADGQGPESIAAISAQVVASGAGAVVCDIAPFGLEVARRAGLPAVLIENFTWDWIYAALAPAEPRFLPWARELARRGMPRKARTLHLQLEPVCRAASGAIPLPLVARSPRLSRSEVASRLGIEASQAIVLVSFGGVAHRLTSSARFGEIPDATFVLLGASEEERWEANVRRLPHHSPIYHPDLVAAADVVVGKLGYSTVAEAVTAGARLMFVPRPGFAESEVLERYVETRVPVARISLAELESGAWVERLPALLAHERLQAQFPPPTAGGRCGARVAADRIIRWWKNLS